jgi:hypothetical protein
METLQKSLEAFMKSHNLDSKVDRHLERLLHHPAVKEWRANHPEWTREKLLGHAGKIREFVQEQQNCNGCRGLYECRNLMRGHRAGLIQYSGILDVTYSPCSYQLKKEQADKKEQLITSHHIPDDIMSARFCHFQQDQKRKSTKQDRACSGQSGDGRGAGALGGVDGARLGCATNLPARACAEPRRRQSARRLRAMAARQSLQGVRPSHGTLD